MGVLTAERRGCGGGCYERAPRLVPRSLQPHGDASVLVTDVHLGSDLWLRQPEHAASPVKEKHTTPCNSTVKSFYY